MKLPQSRIPAEGQAAIPVNVMCLVVEKVGQYRLGEVRRALRLMDGPAKTGAEIRVGVRGRAQAKFARRG